MTKLVAVAFFVLSLTRRIDTSSKHCPHDGPPANKEGADIKTLEQVNVVWRHGARLPIYPTYPNDPYQDLWDASNLLALTKFFNHGIMKL